MAFIDCIDPISQVEKLAVLDSLLDPQIRLFFFFLLNNKSSFVSFIAMFLLETSGIYVFFKFIIVLNANFKLF